MSAWWDEASAAGPTWGELLEAFLQAQTPATARAYRPAVRRFHESMPDRPPTDVTMRDVLAYRDMLRAAGRAPATVLARLAAVSSWFKFLRRQPLPDGSRLVSENPAEDVPAGRVEMYGRVADRQLELQAFRAILAAGDARLRAWLLVHVLTGRRRAEIARLTRDDIEQRGAGAYWYKYRGKGRTQGKWRELPAAAAQAVFAWRPDLCDLTAPRDAQTSIWGVCENTLVRHFKRAAVAAGVDPRHAHVHALRHLGAKLRKAAGADVEEIRDFLDHSNCGTTAIYLFSLEEKRDIRGDSIARQLLDE